VAPKEALVDTRWSGDGEPVVSAEPGADESEQGERQHQAAGDLDDVPGLRSDFLSALDRQPDRREQDGARRSPSAAGRRLSRFRPLQDGIDVEYVDNAQSGPKFPACGIQQMPSTVMSRETPP
jgi:hypothetical protein